MKKRIISLVMAVFLVLALVPLTNIAMAENKGQIAFNTNYPGSITDPNPMDRYSFVLELPGTVTVALTRGTGSGILENFGADVTFFNASNVKIGGSNGGFEFPYSESLLLEPGTYYIEIAQRFPDNSTGLYSGSYNLRAEYHAAAIDDPNNTLETARLLTPGQTISGYITDQTASHFYKYELTQPGRLTVNVARGASNGATQFSYKILDANATSIASDYLVSSSESVSRDLETGTYYVEISKRSSYTGTYDLRSDFIAAGRTAILTNNTRETAQSLTIGQTVRGYISLQNSTDYYQYVLTQPGRLTLSVSRGETIGLSQVSYKLLDASGASIISDYLVSSTESASRDLEAGTYYVEMSKRSSYTGTYNLSASFIESGRTAIKPNNTRATAQLLTAGQTVVGYISHQESVEMYRYVLTQPSKLTVNITRGATIGVSQVNYKILDTNGVSIASDYLVSSSENLSKDLEAGTYYVEISKRSSYTGTYSLSISTPTTNYTITTSVNPTGGGTATANPAAAAQGTTIALSAMASAGYAFENWTVVSGSVTFGNANSPNTSFTMPAGNVSVRANFKVSAKITITATASPANGGTVTGGGEYQKDASVTLLATANTGYTFDGWYDGNTRVSTNATYTFSATVNKEFQARFVSGAWSLNPTSITFASAKLDYNAQSSRSVTISNNGGAALTGVSASITTGGAAFEITASPSASINAGSQSTISICPKTGLQAGTHTGVLTVSADAGNSQTVTLSFTVITSDSDAPTFDNEHSEWATRELNMAFEQELVPPMLRDPEADLRAPITREEFAGIVVLTYENLSGTKVQPATNNPFTDTKDIYVRMAYNIGLMVGLSSTEFAPDMILNRETASTALTRVFKKWHFPEWTFATDDAYTLSYTRPAPFADDANISAWAKDSVYFMAANGIILGVGNNMFAPRNMTSYDDSIGYANATREQALVIAVRMVANLG